MPVLKQQNNVRNYSSEMTSIFLESLDTLDVFGNNSVNNSTLFVATPEIPGLSKKARNFISKIQSFAELKPNWDSYKAIPPDSLNIKDAIGFAKWADRLNLPLYFASPGPNGEILIELKKDAVEAEIHFITNSPSEFLLCDGDLIIIEDSLQGNEELLLQYLL